MKIITCWSTQCSAISQYCIISGQTYWRVHSQCILITIHINNIRVHILSLSCAHVSNGPAKTKIIMFGCKLINVSSNFGRFQFDSIVLSYSPLHFNPIVSIELCTPHIHTSFHIIYISRKLMD